MEGIQFDEIFSIAETDITDAEASYITPPSSQKENIDLATGPVEEYISLFGTKKLSAAETPSKDPDQSAAKVIEDSTAELIVADQSTSSVLHDEGLNLGPICDELIERFTKLPEETGLEDYHQLSPILEDESSISAEPVEDNAANHAIGPFDVTDRASWIQLMQEGNKKKYSLREVNRNSFRGSGWMDADKSGDYDPSLESTKTILPRSTKQEKPIKHKGGEVEPALKRQQYRALNYEQGRKTGQSMPLTFNLSSAKELGSFRRLVEKCFLSSDSANDISERETLDDTHNLHHNESTGVKTRSKSSLVLNGLEGKYGHLLGHSEARGCKPCYEIGIECSLVQASQSYPCGHCLEDGDDCSLLIPPKFKRACQRCKHKRIGCSYSRGGGVGLTACKNCQDANVECIAGPAKSFRIDDILDSGGNKKPQSRSAIKRNLPARRHSTQTEALHPATDTNIYRDGSLAGLTIPLPRIPSIDDEKETKARVPPKKQVINSRVQKQKSTRNNKIAHFRSQETAKKNIPIKRNQGQRRNPKTEPKVDGGRFIYITTSYCHPVRFNWIPPPPLTPSCRSESPPNRKSQSDSSLGLSSFPCHFCTQPGLTYGLVGLGQLRVEVIYWEYDPSLGYEELDGWSKSGLEQTRMCTSCTMARMIICLCESHVIRPIAGLDPRNFDHDAAMRGVLKKTMGLEFGDKLKENGQNEQQEEVKWCSICIFPAFYECCTRPMYSNTGLPTSPTDDTGCGLLLCEVCASRLMGTSCPSYRRDPHQRSSTASAGNSTSNRSVSYDRSRKVPKAGIKVQVSLDAHIATSKNDYFNYPDGLRADACFLATTGELMRRLSHAPVTDPVPAQVISDDEEDIIGVDAYSNFSNEKCPQNPFYENSHQKGNAFKKDDLKNDMFIISDDSSSDTNTNTESKKNKSSPTTEKGNPKSNPRPKPKAQPKRTTDSASKNGRNTTTASGSRPDEGIRAGTWGMGGFIDLT